VRARAEVKVNEPNRQQAEMPERGNNQPAIKSLYSCQHHRYCRTARPGKHYTQRGEGLSNYFAVLEKGSGEKLRSGRVDLLQ